LFLFFVLLLIFVSDLSSRFESVNSGADGDTMD